MDIIDRPIYLNHIVSHLNRGMMLVLVGQRRVGKSFLLKSLERWIRTNKPTANVVYIDKELPQFADVNTATTLYDYAAGHLPIGQENYLLVDEIQNIARYEDALRGLYAEGRCQIVITGSNAYIFSSELSTRLSGRYIEIPVHTLTYDEFLTFRGITDSDKALTAYLRIGGLPGLTAYELDSTSQISDYLQGVYNTIIVRDIIEREDIRNIKFLRNLATFVADNVGKLFSVSNIVNYLRSGGEKVSYELVNRYLEFLSNAMIIRQVARYDIHGKRLFDTLGKHYFADHGLRNLLAGFNLRASIEKVMENVVYLHLLTRGYEVFIGILRAGEVDFVAVRNEERAYIQVTYLLGSDETITREFGTLWNIADNHPKIVVSMDPVSGELPQYPGIRHVHLREFLRPDFPLTLPNS